MHELFLAIFAMRYKSSKVLSLADFPLQGDWETVVQFRAQLKLHNPYLDLERDYKNVGDAFVGVLRPALISRADILFGSVSTWPALVRVIVILNGTRRSGPCKRWNTPRHRSAPCWCIKRIRQARLLQSDPVNSEA